MNRPSTKSNPKTRVLVKRLPPKAKGVTLKNGEVRLKRGYKFVKQADGAISVEKIGGGETGMTGKWRCDCDTWSGAGTCIITSNDFMLTCLQGTCGECNLTMEIEGVSTPIIKYTY